MKILFPRLGAVLGALFVSITPGVQAVPVSYQREIAPLFRANCVGCHRASKQKGGLDLSSPMSIAKGGKHGAIFTPGKPDGSRLMRDISGDEPAMPEGDEPLSAHDVELIRRWIAEGAVDDSHGEAAKRQRRTAPIYERLPSVPSIAFSPDGSLLAVAGWHEVVLHAGDGSSVVGRLVGDSPRVESLAFSTDGRFLAVAGGVPSEVGEVQVWEVAQRQLVRSIKTSGDSLYGVSFSPDGRLVAVGCADKMVRVFELEGGREVMKCDNHIDWVFATAFNHDGRRVISGSRDRALKLIDLASGQLIDDVNVPREPLQCLARHPAEDLAVYGSADGSIRMNKMEPRGGRLAEGDNKEHSFVREFGRLSSPVNALAFSSDGTWLAAVSAKGDARIYTVADGKNVSTLKAPAEALFAVAFHPTQRVVAAAGFDGKVRFFDPVKGGELLAFDSVPLTTKEK